MRFESARRAATLAAILVLWSCGSADESGSRVDGAGGTGGEVGQAGSGGDGGGGTGGTVGPQAPQVTAAERIGAHPFGPYRAILPARAGSLDVFGLMAIDAIPDELGAPDLETDGNGIAIVGGGIAVLDRRTGAVRTFGAGEGIPEAPVFDSAGNVVGTGTSSIYDLAWVTPDESFVGATVEGVLSGRLAADGAVAFHFATVPSPGRGDTGVFEIDVSAGEPIAGTTHGVAVLDPATLEVQRWLEVGTDEGLSVTWDLLATELDGTPVVAVIVGTFERPGHVAVVEGGTTHTFTFEGNPVGLGAIPGAVLVGVLEPDGRGSIQAIRRGSEGFSAEPFRTADQLYSPNTNSVLPVAFAHDPVRNELHIGARFFAGSRTYPGGLYRVSLARDVEPWMGVEDAVPRLEAEERLVPRGIIDMAIDGDGGLYAIGINPSESGPAEAGLLRWEFLPDQQRRVYRPIVSGVHAVTVDPNGDTWLGLRDGLSAYNHPPRNYNLMSGVCRLLDNGSCQLFPPRVTAEPLRGEGDLPDTLYRISADPKTADVAFGSEVRHELAVLTIRDNLYVRRHDVTRVVDLGRLRVDRWASRIAWDTTGGLWIASPMEWDRDCPSDTCQDFGPHGVARLRLDTEARPVEARRFVRRPAIDGFDVGGLPSNTAHAILPLPGEDHVLVALGAERQIRESLHHLPPVSPDGILGGIVEIEGTELRPIVAPEGVEFGDVVELVRLVDGRILALDTLAGIFEVDLEAGAAVRVIERAWPAEARPLSMAADASGRIAVGTTAGVWAFAPDGSGARVSGPEHRFAWRVHFVADGVLYAGTDEGLVRIALDGAALPPRGRAGPLPAEPWELPPSCGGFEGCWCDFESDCRSGSICECDETRTDCRCRPAPVECDGGEGCVCEDVSDCVGETAECVCFGDNGCYCRNDLADCGGVLGCVCTDRTPCGDGLECVHHVCEAIPSCEFSCTCETETGCPDGWSRNEDPANPSACACGLPVGCQMECSCPTENGCPPNQHCDDGMCVWG